MGFSGWGLGGGEKFDYLEYCGAMDHAFDRRHKGCTFFGESLYTASVGDVAFEHSDLGSQSL